MRNKNYESLIESLKEFGYCIVKADLFTTFAIYTLLKYGKVFRDAIKDVEEIQNQDGVRFKLLSYENR